MAKKRKKVFKGVRYIANQLKSYYPKRYTSYASALPRAREIVDTLNLRGLKVTWSNALTLERKPRIGGAKGATPYIPPELLEMNHYWFLSDYPDYILSTSNKIFFTSDLIPASLEDMQGGELYDYGEYFGSYVAHCNSLNQEEERNGKVYDSEFYVMCTPPTENKNKKRWESKIISVNIDKDEVDYGFDPNKPNVRPTLSYYQQQAEEGKKPAKVEKEIRVEPSSKSEIVTGSSEAEKKLEIERIKAEAEKSKAESKANLIKLFMNKELTKAEFKEMMRIIE